MNKISSTNSILDMMTMAVQQKTKGKGLEYGSDFKEMFQNTLNMQKDNQPRTAQAEPKKVNAVQHEPETASRDESHKTDDKSVTSESPTKDVQLGQDKAQKTEMQDSQAPVKEEVAEEAAAAMIVTPIQIQDEPEQEMQTDVKAEQDIVEVPKEKDTVTAPKEQDTVAVPKEQDTVKVPPQKDTATQPPTQMTNGPIVQTVSTPIRYARQISELMQAQASNAEPEQPQDGDDLLSMIEKVEVISPESEADDTQTGVASLPKFTIATTDEANDRLRNMVEQAAKSLGEMNAKETSKENKVPEELRAKVPEEVVAHREYPATIRMVEKNISEAMRDQKELLPESRPITINEQVVPTAPAPVLQQPERTEVLPVAQTSEPYVPQTVNQIHVEVLRNIDLQNMQFRMQLNPRELGPLDVRMVVESGRVMSMEIIASSTRTAEILSRGIESLIASLRMSGLDVQSVIITPTEAQSGHLHGDRNLERQEDMNNQQQSGKGKQAKSDDEGEDEYNQEQDDEQSPEKLLDKAI